MLVDFEKQLPKITVVMENNYCMFVQIPAYALGVAGWGGGGGGGGGAGDLHRLVHQVLQAMDNRC